MNSFSSMLAILGLLSLSSGTHADNELASMDLEQLMEMNVTTVAKRNQTFSSAAAAIYTITQEDIRRAGATNLPEVLRQSPGIEVARINPGMWAVTARGFNGHAANKLLVMIDGRSVYSPISGGVYWDQQMPSLDDIQRIEIIRGPGASLWGANAVNGVINIITYDTEQTQGLRVTTGAGNEEKGYFRSRYGFRNGNLTGRVNAQARSVDEAVLAESGDPSDDDYQGYQLGSRFDWRPTVIDKLSLDMGFTRTHKHIDVFIPDSLRPLIENPPPALAADLDAEVRDSLGARNAYLMSSWLHELKNGDSFSFQFYADAENRIEPVYEYNRFTTDLELQYNVAATERHRFTWGIGNRNTKDRVYGTFMVYTEMPDAQYSTTTLFVQDEYRFATDWVSTLGAKVEESSSTDTEFQPSLRLAWMPFATTTLWVAASRAVKTPSRVDRSIELRAAAPQGAIDAVNALFPDVIPYQVVQGNDDYESEVVYAYEAGVRLQPHDDLLVDIATFQNQYKGLITFMPELDLTRLRVFDPVYPYVGWLTYPANITDAEAEGAELSMHYVPHADWKVKFAYTYYNLAILTGIPDYPTSGFVPQSPQHQGYITSSHTLAQSWELDATLRYVDEVSEGFAPAYTAVDFRVARSISPHADIAVIGKDIFDSHRPEIVNRIMGPNPTELERSIYLQFSWRE